MAVWGVLSSVLSPVGRWVLWSLRRIAVVQSTTHFVTTDRMLTTPAFLELPCEMEYVHIKPDG